MCKLIKFMRKFYISTQILHGNALFSGRIYTSGIFFTRPPVVTSFKSVDKEIDKEGEEVFFKEVDKETHKEVEMDWETDKEVEVEVDMEMDKETDKEVEEEVDEEVDKETDKVLEKEVV